jgi:tripartite-type tricarboxylate transporter receptor subunit TctC
MHSRCSRRLLVAALIAPALLSTAAFASDAYPSRPIKFIVPFPPGGGTDTLARTLAQEIGKLLKTAVVVENKPGAATNVASAYVANQPADGYTVLIGTISFAANPSLYKNLGYQPEDFQPLALLANSPSVLVVKADSPARQVRDLVAAGKGSPGSMNYASWGNGSGAHLAAELFRQTTGTPATHIPYAGGGPALNSVLAGQTDFLFASVLPVQAMLKANRLRALGVAAETRLASLPDVPTFKEQGIPLVTGTWFGVFVPARTPPAAVATLEKALRQSMDQPEVRQAIVRDGATPGYVDPKRFKTFVDEERRRWATVIQAAHIQPE